VIVLASLAVLGATYAAGWRTSGLAQGSAAAIFPAAVLMGFAFPIALALWTRPRAGAAPREVGSVYAANVVGGIAGAIVGGFVLLPWLGSRRSLIVCAALYLAMSVVLLVASRRRLAAVTAVVLFVLAARVVPDPFDVTLARRHGRGERIFWKEEGVQTSVSIHTHAFQGWLMYLDGLHQASDAPEMVRLHRLIGHLPMVLHPEPQRTLVVGLGGGATPGAVSQHDTDVLVVELSDTVRKGAAFFRHVNYDLFAQPNVHVRVDDGRNFLARTTDRFDVVTADLIQPIHAGAGNLYSREYFQLVRHALADDGLVLQWIGHRPETQYKLIMRTFLDVFPYTTLWFDGQLMVGSTRPLRISPAAFDTKRARPVTRAALDEVGLDSFATLLSWYVAGPDELRRFVGPGPLLTDDRPLVEYHRSLPAGDPDVRLAGVRGDVNEILAR
jgi:spermidine synthase